MKKSGQVILILFLAITSCGAFAQLHDSYTINPRLAASASNYKNFNSAVKDLVLGIRNDGGPVHGPSVSGSVVFSVADTVYLEKVEIVQIAGASLINTITFRSASGDSSKVILNDTTHGGAALYLNGADFLIFKQLTIQHDNGIVVKLGNIANHNIFSSCKLLGTAAGDDYGVDYSVIYSDITADSNNVFYNNRILDGSYGIYYYGDNYDFETGTQIENNTFINQNYSGISIYNQQGILINANTIITNVENADYRGIEAGYCNGKLLVTNNRISGGQYLGLYLNNNIAVSTDKALVANNFVQTQDSSASYGIYVEYCEFQNIYNNSVSVNTGDNIDNAAFYLNGGLNVNVVNNIFANNGNGYSIYIYDDGSGISSSDYNDLYTRGVYLAYLNANDYWGLSDLKTAWGKNLHSISVNPFYRSAIDLQPNSLPLDNLAGNQILVAKDIDGTTRTVVKHDIGAKEFTTTKLNSGISGIYIENFVCAGTYDVHAIIRNYGISTLTSDTIKWSVDGVAQQEFNYTGSVAQMMSDTIVIGQYNYVPEIYSAVNFSVWTCAPNAGIDLDNTDDTSKVSILPGIFGEFTIGKSSNMDFPSLNKAIDFLDSNSICGAIVFNIENGIYNDGDIIINQLNGLSKINTITFQSASGDSSKVIINGSGNLNENAVTLDGADYIVFKKLTIQVTGEKNKVMDFRNGANNNSILNCVLKNKVTSDVSSDYSIIYSDQYDNNNNTFRGNNFVNGSYGAYWSGSNSASGNVFENNEFSNQNYYGIYSSNMDDFDLSDNTFKNKSYASSGYIAYEANGHKGNLNVLNNKITLHQGHSAIYVHNINDNVFIKNNLITIDSTTTDAANLIDAEFIDYAEIANNTLSFLHTNANATSIFASSLDAFVTHDNLINIDVQGFAYGMYLEKIKRAEVYFNEMNVKSTNAANGIYTNEFTNSKLYENTLNVISANNEAHGLDVYNSIKSKYYENIITVASGENNSLGIYNESDSKSDFYYNTIKSTTSASNDGTAYGWYSYDCGGTSIYQNTFDVHSTKAAYGMDLDQGDAYLLVQNNFISTTGSTSVVGVYIWGALSSDFNNNNVNVYGTSVYISSVMDLSYSSDFKMMNNVLSNNGDGFIIYDEGAYIAQSNNNDLFTSGTSFGYWDGNEAIAFSDWKVATKLDANSISVDPLFHSPTDLHVCSSALDGTGALLSTVTRDFDGENRNSSTPDIGADEFTFNPYVLNLGDDFTFCGSEILNAGSLSGATYLWSSGATTQSITVSANGTYSVTVSDGLCISTSDVVVALKSSSLKSPTIVNLGSDASYCVNHVLDAGNPGLKYSWSNGATTQTINATQSGNYSVIVTDKICRATAQITLDIHPLPIVNLGANTTICTSQVLDAGNPGKFFLWSTGASTKTITVSLTNTYSVVVSDGLGCKGAGSVKVTRPLLPVDLGADISVCDSHILDAGNTGAKYLWSNGASTKTINVTSTGNYSVTATGAGGCKSADAILVIVNKTPSISLGADVTVCGDYTINAAYPQASYLWSNEASTSAITVSSSGIYSVTISKDACSISDSVKVSVATPFVVDLGADKTICKPLNATLDAGIGGVTYVWSPGGETTQSISASATGNYKVSVNKGACVSSDEVLVIVDICLGLEEILSENTVNVFPNPSADNFILTFNDLNESDVTLRVTSLSGQEVYADKFDQHSGTFETKINLSNQASGIYFLQIIIGEKQINRKLILNN